MQFFIMFFVAVFVFTSCQKDENLNPNKLSNSTWVITQYKESTVAYPEILNDTLFFKTNSVYTYNGIEQSYNLIYNGSQPKLTLNGTLFGNLSGFIPQGFSVYGKINASTFSVLSIGDSEKEYLLWMERL
ncbi:MAG: hypothetical protein WC994_04075 [Brumimicrobium sp.]